MLQKSVALIKDGAQNRPIKKKKQGIDELHGRKQMIRIADKSPEGWDTVKDSVASDSVDKRKIQLRIEH